MKPVRERERLDLIAAGLGNHEIAQPRHLGRISARISPGVSTFPVFTASRNPCSAQFATQTTQFSMSSLVERLLQMRRIQETTRPSDTSSARAADPFR